MHAAAVEDDGAVEHRPVGFRRLLEHAHESSLDLLHLIFGVTDAAEILVEFPLVGRAQPAVQRLGVAADRIEDRPPLGVADKRRRFVRRRFGHEKPFEDPSRGIFGGQWCTGRFFRRAGRGRRS
jgi:hypothetical protein